MASESACLLERRVKQEESLGGREPPRLTDLADPWWRGSALVESELLERKYELMSHKTEVPRFL